MTKLLTLALLLALVLIAQDDYRARQHARANDEAATECARRTGFVYNCANGTQSAECGQ